MTEILELISSWINNPGLQHVLWPLKTLSILATLGLLGVIIFTLKNSSYLQVNYLQEASEYSGYHPYGLGPRQNEWKKKVKARIEGKDPTEHKLAILEADKIFDEVIQRMNYGGSTREERLAKVPDVAVPTIDDVRNAHRIHNNIVQDPTYLITEIEAKRVVAIYEQALKGLDVL